MRTGAPGGVIPQLRIIPAEGNICELGLSVEIVRLLAVK
jgi:hypothetical protein